MKDFLIEDGVLVKYLGEDSDVVIPEGITAIGEKAFDECECLESVVIPEGVITIGESAFEDCENLTCVFLPNTLVSIERKAFEDCKSLKQIVLPERVRALGKEAFADCDNLQGITLPYRNIKIPVGMLECVEITTHNLATLYVFQRTKTAERIFAEHQKEFSAEELAGEMLAALDGHESMRRCEKVALYIKEHKEDLSKQVMEYAETVFGHINATALLN